MLINNSDFCHYRRSIIRSHFLFNTQCVAEVK